MQLKNDNVQGFDTEWDEVPLSMTKVPDEDTLENLHRKQLHFSEELEPLMVLYLQDTVLKGVKACYSRLQHMVRGYFEQYMTDNNLNARNEDMSLQGAAAWKGNPKGKFKR